MVEINYATEKDMRSWLKFDTEIRKEELVLKFRDKRPI